MEEMEKPDGVARWLKKVAEHPKKAVLETLLLRSMKQATYEITNIGHFGLASTAYAHFTSPIRRYPDVQVHRAVKRLLRGGKPDTRSTRCRVQNPPGTRCVRLGGIAVSERFQVAFEEIIAVVDVTGNCRGS